MIPGKEALKKMSILNFRIKPSHETTAYDDFVSLGPIKYLKQFQVSQGQLRANTKISRNKVREWKYLGVFLPPDLHLLHS